MVKTVPSPTRNLLNGPSAYALWMRARRWVFAPAVVFLVALVLMKVGVPQSWVTDGLMAVFLISAVPFSVFLQWAPSKERKEVRAGYTTLPRSHKDVEQRDPFLGAPIRSPGGEYLPPQDFRKICTEGKARANRSRIKL